MVKYFIEITILIKIQTGELSIRRGNTGGSKSLKQYNLKPLVFILSFGLPIKFLAKY